MFSRWLPIDGDGEAREMEGEARDELTRDEFGTGVEPAVRGGEELHDESRSVRSDDAVSECFKKFSERGPSMERGSQAKGHVRRLLAGREGPSEGTNIPLSPIINFVVPRCTFTARGSSSAPPVAEGCHVPRVRAFGGRRCGFEAPRARSPGQ